jgi:hypothetical protein
VEGRGEDDRKFDYDAAAHLVYVQPLFSNAGRHEDVSVPLVERLSQVHGEKQW